MKLNKKAFMVLAGTSLLAVALVGCSSKDEAPKTEDTVVTTPEKEEVKEEVKDETDTNTDENADENVEVAVTSNVTDTIIKTITEGLEIAKTQPADDTLLVDMYNLKAEDVNSFSVQLPMMNVHAQEIAVFEIKDGNTDVIEGAIKFRQESLVKTWESYLPEQLELVQNSKTSKNDEFMLYVVSSDAEVIVEKFEALTIDEIKAMQVIEDVVAEDGAETEESTGEVAEDGTEKEEVKDAE